MVYMNINMKIENRKRFIKLIQIVALGAIVLLTACGGPPKVWVLGSSEGVTSVKFNKAPRFVYMQGKVFKGADTEYKIGKSSYLQFMLEEEGDYSVSYKAPGSEGKLDFSASDAHGALTVLDPTAKKYVVALDVGLVYSEEKINGAFPISQLLKPAQVHNLEVDPNHSFWWTSKLPNSLTGVEVGGSTSITAHKIFALLPNVVEGVSKPDLAKKLSDAVISIESR